METPGNQESPQTHAHLEISMDLQNHGLQLTIKAPNLEIAYAMARWAADEIKRAIDAEWAKAHGQRVIVAGGPLAKISTRN